LANHNNKSQLIDVSGISSSQENPPPFDYRIIRDDFHEILRATGNHLERDWPSRYADAASGQMVLLQLVRLAITSYKTILFIYSDLNDGANRDPHMVLSTPPLTRTILEIIGSVLYLLEDLPRHTDLFFRAAWRDDYEMLIKYRQRYAGLPRWDAYIELRSKGVAKLEAQLGITKKDKENLNNILFWPTLGKIRKRLRKDYPNSSALPYIEFLDDWFYRELSTQSHLEPRGLGQMGLHFLGIEDLKEISGDDRDGIRERLDEKLQEFRLTQFWTAITLILSLVSEVELHFCYGLKQRILIIWALINQHSEISQEVYKERYEKLLE
jgi:hypothetical protein